jgi:uncharacterized membrane protein required for colicin V production
VNTYDIAIIVILAIFALSGWIYGFVRAIGGIISWFGAIILTGFFYPYTAALLRKTSLFGVLRQKIADSLPYADQAELLNELSQNEFIRDQLMANNNAEVRRMFDVGEEGYVSAFLANAVINLISVIAVFIIAMLIMAMVVNALNIVSKLPVLNIFNSAGGAIAGLARGIIILWIFMAAISIYILNHQEIYDGIHGGLINSFLFENNPVVNWLVRLTP